MDVEETETNSHPGTDPATGNPETSPEKVVKEDPDTVDVSVEDMTPEEALALLMQARPVRATRKVVGEIRTGDGPKDVREIPMTLRSLSGNEIKDIRKHAEIPLNRDQRRKGVEPEIDEGMYRRLVIVNGVLTPSLTSPELLSAQGCERGEELVSKLFLDGHQTILFAKIMETSGYSEDAVRDLGEN